MAKFENEGYCPNQWLDLSSDTRLIGLWCLIGPSVVYETKDALGCQPDLTTCNKAFSKDVIAYDLLSAIVKKNVNAYKILIHQLHNGACNCQSISDIQKVINESVNPELIVSAGSNFAVVLADAEYGLDVWIWDLTSVY